MGEFQYDGFTFAINDVRLPSFCASSTSTRSGTGPGTGFVATWSDFHFDKAYIVAKGFIFLSVDPGHNAIGAVAGAGAGSGLGLLCLQLEIQNGIDIMLY